MSDPKLFHALVKSQHSATSATKMIQFEGQLIIEPPLACQSWANYFSTLCNPSPALGPPLPTFARSLSELSTLNYETVSATNSVLCQSVSPPIVPPDIVAVRLRTLMV